MQKTAWDPAHGRVGENGLYRDFMVRLLKLDWPSKLLSKSRLSIPRTDWKRKCKSCSQILWVAAVHVVGKRAVGPHFGVPC